MALDGDDTSSTIYIDDLNPLNPEGDTPKSHGDDHLRFIKKVLKNTFPNISGEVTPTHIELNYVNNVTSQLSGNSQAATLENKTLTSPAINGGSLNNTITFNGEISAGGVAISPTELSYLNNLAENVQTVLSAALRSGADGIVDDLQIQGSGYFDAVVTDTIIENALSVNWQNGNKHYVNLTANITSMAWTNPAGPTNVTLVIDQTGSYTVAGWPSAVRWPSSATPTVTTTSGNRDVFNFYWDGTYYYGAYVQNYSE